MVKCDKSKVKQSYPKRGKPVRKAGTQSHGS